MKNIDIVRTRQVEQRCRKNFEKWFQQIQYNKKFQKQIRKTPQSIENN